MVAGKFEKFGRIYVSLGVGDPPSASLPAEPWGIGITDLRDNILFLCFFFDIYYHSGEISLFLFHLSFLYCYGYIPPSLPFSLYISIEKWNLSLLFWERFRFIIIIFFLSVFLFTGEKAHHQSDSLL